MILTLRLASGETHSVTLSDSLLVGRGADCGLVLSDDQVSVRHAVLRAGPDGSVSVEDLQSTNGTFVNGVRIAGAVALRGGEEIRFGETVLLVPAQGQTATPAVAAVTPLPPPPGQTPAAAPVPAAQTPKGSNRAKTIWIAAAAIVVVIALIGGFLVFGTKSSPPAPSPLARPSRAASTPTAAPATGLPAEGRVEGVFGGTYGWNFTPQCATGPCSVTSKVKKSVLHFKYNPVTNLYTAVSHQPTSCSGKSVSFPLKTTNTFTFRVVSSSDAGGVWEADTIKGDDTTSIKGASKTVGNTRYTCDTKYTKKKWIGTKV